MPSKLKYFSAAPCNGDCSGPIEMTSDDTLIIRDVPIGIYHDKIMMTTEIDRSAGTIKKIWRAFVFTWLKVYALDDYATAEIRDKRRLIEGYPLHFFSVYISGKGRRLKVYSTEDSERAKSVQNALSAFLSRSNVST